MKSIKNFFAAACIVIGAACLVVAFVATIVYAHPAVPAAIAAVVIGFAIGYMVGEKDAKEPQPA
jgi:hypothetical protein